MNTETFNIIKAAFPNGILNAEEKQRLETLSAQADPAKDRAQSLVLGALDRAVGHHLGKAQALATGETMPESWAHIRAGKSLLETIRNILDQPEGTLWASDANIVALLTGQTPEASLDSVGGMAALQALLDTPTPFERFLAGEQVAGFDTPPDEPPMDGTFDAAAIERMQAEIDKSEAA